MLAGHVGAALLGKAWRPELPLCPLVLAAQLPDAVQAGLLIFGIERFSIDPDSTGPSAVDPAWVPLSHSLLGTLVLALVAAAAAHRWLAWARPASGLVALLVLSHWLLDAVVEPALPLLGPLGEIGLGLGATVAGSWVLDVGILVAGLTAVGLRAAPRGPIGWLAVPGWAAAVLAFHVGITLGAPPPASPMLLAVSTWGLVQVLALTGGWVGRLLSTPP